MFILTIISFYFETINKKFKIFILVFHNNMFKNLHVYLFFNNIIFYKLIFGWCVFVEMNNGGSNGFAPSESEVKQLFLPYRGYCGRKGVN